MKEKEIQFMKLNFFGRVTCEEKEIKKVELRICEAKVLQERVTVHTRVKFNMKEKKMKYMNMI